MSQRRILWIEQNVEKVVVGVVGAVLVGAAALQVLHQPNKVKVGTGPEVAPEKVNSIVAQAAEVLKRKLSTSNPPETPKVSTDIAKTLDERMVAPARPAARMTRLGHAPKFEKVENQGSIGNDVFATLQVRAPVNVIGATLAGTIHPLERVWHTDLAAVLPPQQPFDKMGVSVEGTFNAAALFDALMADPDGDGPVQPMPRGLWQDPMTQDVLVDILSVELERELVRPAPGSGEKPGAKATIVGMPGRFDVKKYWADNVHAPGDVRVAVQALRGVTEQIQRPPYYALIAGQQWDEPKAMRERWAGAEDQGQINRLKGELASAKEQLKIATDDLAKLPPVGGNAAPSPRAGDRDPPPIRGNRGGGRNTGPRPGPGGGKQTQPKDLDPITLRQNAQAKVARFKSQVARLERSLSALGVAVVQPPVSEVGQPVEVSVDMYDNEELKLWAHDMTAAPGAAYRYRMRVVVNNPLYGQRLVEAQKAVATESLVYGQFSEWSESVEVDALSEFFVTSASEANPPASSQPASSAALIVFYYGQWREAILRVTPGDVFVAEIKVPELPIYDLIKLGELHPESKGIPGTPNAPVPAPAAGSNPDGGGGRGPGKIAPAAQDANNVPPAPARDGPAKPMNDGVARIEGAPSLPGPKALSAGVASVFLDAQRLIVPGTNLAGQQKVVVAAILRDPNGLVVARSPENDKASSSYKRLQALIRSQQLANAPVNNNKPPLGQPAQPNQPPRSPTQPGEGGSGGG